MVWVNAEANTEHRQGEVAEDLPGSDKSVACVKRNTKELGRPRCFLRVQVGETDQKKVSRGTSGSQISS
jgi:hypothetical protein